MAKLDLDSLKDNFPGVDKFVRKYTTETLMVIAIFVAGFSSYAHFFWGTVGWSIIFMTIGAGFGIFFPSLIDQGLRKIFAISSGNKTGELIADGAKIAVALFVPFVYFCFLGLLVGTGYHHYSRFGQHKGGK